MRQIVLDTETTGLETSEGHRIIEIGCVELVERRLTGKHYHVYINPERKVDEGAFKVHGISDEFLSDKPVFDEVINDFLAFVSDSELIIHNAAFDMGFLNHELNLARRGPRPLEKQCKVVDTLIMAREKHPRQKNNLDALCRRYDIDNSKRDLHGALLDAEILALVYLAMTGGQSDMFSVATSTNEENNSHLFKNIKLQATLQNLNVIKPNEQEQTAHELFNAMVLKKSGKDDIWDA